MNRESTLRRALRLAGWMTSGLLLAELAGHFMARLDNGKGPDGATIFVSVAILTWAVIPVMFTLGRTTSLASLDRRRARGGVLLIFGGVWIPVGVFLHLLATVLRMVGLAGETHPVLGPPPIGAIYSLTWFPFVTYAACLVG